MASPNQPADPYRSHNHDQASHDNGHDQSPLGGDHSSGAPQVSPLQYPWMAHIPPISPDEFPRASRPLVFEGFVPNARNLPPSRSAGNSYGPSSRATRTIQGFVPSLLQPQSQPAGSLSPDLISNQAHYSPRGIHGVQEDDLAAHHRSQDAPGASPVWSGFNHVLQPSNHGPPFATYPQDMPPFPQQKLHELRTLRRHDTDDQDGETAADDNDDDEESEDEGDTPGMGDVVSGFGVNPLTGVPTIQPPTPARRPRGRPPKKRRKKGTGQRGGWSKGMKLGPRPEIDPGPEFAELHQSAISAFIDEQDVDKAMDLVLKAIAVNPEIWAAYNLLAELHYSRGDEEKACAVLFHGAHSAARDPEVWFQVADACLARKTGDRQTNVKQASYCVSVNIKANRKDYDSRFRRATYNKELGCYVQSFKDLEQILRDMPRNSSVLRLWAEIAIEIHQIDQAKRLYDEAIEHYKENGLDADGVESLTWGDINVYVQLVSQEWDAEPSLQTGTKVLKELSRWRLGRERETYWDEFTDDDREFDVDDEPRRVLVDHFRPGTYHLDQYGLGLPLELRVKLGLLRLKQGPESFDEAMAHFEWLEPEDLEAGSNVYEYPDLFLEVAQALHDAKEHQQALRYFEGLKVTGMHSDTDFWLGIAACSYICNKKEQAIECYEVAKASDENCGEARYQLSKLYRDAGEKALAMQNAREAIVIAEKSTATTTGRRRYERKDQRLARQAAENALKQAYKLPGPVPQGPIIERIEERLQQPRARKKYKPRKKVTEKTLGDNTEGAARSASEDVATDEEDELHDEDTDVEGSQHEDLEENLPRRVARRDGRRRGGEQTEEDVDTIPNHKQQTSRSSKIPKVPKTKPPKPQHLTSAQRDAYRSKNVAELYDLLVTCTAPMRAGDQEALTTWMNSADSLVTDFRKNRAFYPAERHARFAGYDADDAVDTRRRHHVKINKPRQPGSDNESDLPVEYRGIPFTAWLDVFLEYALLLSLTESPGAKAKCYTTINAALDCNIWYHSAQSTLLIYVTYLSCALTLRDESTLFNTVIRWFVRSSPYSTEPYRLFAALNLLYPHDVKAGKENQNGNAVFRSGPAQKFFFRAVMSLDYFLPEDYNAAGAEGPPPPYMRERPNFLSENVAEAERENLGPQEMNVVLLTLYAHVLYAGGSFPAALNYLYRAYSVDPDNAVVCLSLGLSYLHELAKRQTNDRHGYAVMGWSWVGEYEAARRRWAKEKEDNGVQGVSKAVDAEIAFNKARIWQMLGMGDLAVRGYSGALSSPEMMDQDATGEEKHGYRMETAYTMAQMYALSGNMEMARDISERYLVV